ncbi:hypothetical protein ACP70R_002204 [Stipagrostis hirtigluma subsp. patula]
MPPSSLPRAPPPPLRSAPLWPLCVANPEPQTTTTSHGRRSRRGLPPIRRIDDDDDFFSEFNPHLYDGGYDLAATYGPPLLPSANPCYPSQTLPPAPLSRRRLEEMAREPVDDSPGATVRVGDERGGAEGRVVRARPLEEVHPAG